MFEDTRSLPIAVDTDGGAETTSQPVTVTVQGGTLAATYATSSDGPQTAVSNGGIISYGVITQSESPAYTLTLTNPSTSPMAVTLEAGNLYDPTGAWLACTDDGTPNDSLDMPPDSQIAGTLPLTEYKGVYTIEATTMNPDRDHRGRGRRRQPAANRPTNEFVGCRG